MAASVAGKRMSTTTFEISEPLEAMEGQKVQLSSSNAEANDESGECKSICVTSNEDDAIAPLQQPGATAVPFDSIGSLSSDDDIQAIKARARKARSSVAGIRNQHDSTGSASSDNDQDRTENLRSFMSENKAQYDSTSSASSDDDIKAIKARARRARTSLEQPGVETVRNDDEKKIGSVRSSTAENETLEYASAYAHAPERQETLVARSASGSADSIKAIKDRARQARVSMTASLVGAVSVRDDDDEINLSASQNIPQNSMGDFETSEAQNSARNSERSNFSDSIQSIKNRARTARNSLAPSLPQPGVVAVLDNQVTASNNESESLTDAQLAGGTSGRNPQAPRNRRANYPQGSYISQIRLEKEAALRPGNNAHWIDPLSGPSTRQLSTREMLPYNRDAGAYDMYANNPTFPRNSTSVDSGIQDPANTSIIPNMDPPEDDALNAPVQHQLVWEREQDEKGAHGPEINRHLCLLGGCVVLLVVSAVAVALGVTLGGNKGVPAAPSEAPVQSTDSPAAILTSECMAAVDDDGQSSRFLQFSEMLGLSEPNTPRRGAMCWLTDADASQIDPSDQTAAEQRFSLAVFYFSTLPEGGDDSVLTNWLNEGSECEWQDVTCDNEKIVSLGLSGVGLEGSIPPEVSLLSSLSQLLLDGNMLNGTIPDELYQLTTLSILNLEGNFLTGSLSQQVGNLTMLETLSLGQNEYMTGVLPDDLFSLTGLSTLGVSSIL